MDGMIEYYMETYKMTFNEAAKQLLRQGYNTLIRQELDKQEREEPEILTN